MPGRTAPLEAVRLVGHELEGDRPSSLEARLAFAQERTSRLYRIAELIGRYKPEHDIKSGKWHVFDAEAHKQLDAEYTDEATARAGARLAAACDIDALYDPREGR